MWNPLCTNLSRVIITCVHRLPGNALSMCILRSQCPGGVETVSFRSQAFPPYLPSLPIFASGGMSTVCAASPLSSFSRSSSSSSLVPTTAMSTAFDFATSKKNSRSSERIWRIESVVTSRFQDRRVTSSNAPFNFWRPTFRCSWWNCRLSQLDH